MSLRIYLLIFATLAFSAIAFADPQDNGYQMKYFSNLNVGDSVINISNDGNLQTGITASGNNGSICVNVYAFAPDEQLVSCCACPVTPNGLASLSVTNDLTSNVLTPAVPTSITVKLIVTDASSVSVCNAAAPGTVVNAGPVAWGTTLHAAPTTPVSYMVTETPFTPYTPGHNELSGQVQDCFFVQRLGSGFGICKSCRLGGLGADHQ